MGQRQREVWQFGSEAPTSHGAAKRPGSGGPAALGVLRTLLLWLLLVTLGAGEEQAQVSLDDATVIENRLDGFAVDDVITGCGPLVLDPLVAASGLLDTTAWGSPRGCVH